MEEYVSLAEASPQVGLKPDALRLKILQGELRGIQPGGPRGKLFISKTEVERLRQPLTPRSGQR